MTSTRRVLLRRVASYRLPILALLACVACSNASESPSVARDGTDPAGPAECSSGQRPTVDGECLAVGPEACAEGFRPASDSWGCSAVVAKTCSGATRAELGSDECVRLDDCDAEFPPKDATKVVSNDAELTAALASVSKGAVIALDAGTYAPIVIKRDVTLVGRCASKVKFRGDAERGILVDGAKKVSLRSLTVTGFQGGIATGWSGGQVDASAIVLIDNVIDVVAGGGTTELSNSVIESTVSEQNGGSVAALGGAAITMTQVQFRNRQTVVSAYENDSSVTLRRSVARYEGSSRKGNLVIAAGGATVTVEESLLSTRAGQLLFATDKLPGTPVSGKTTGGTIRIKRSELQQIGFVGEEALSKAAAGGHIETEDTSVLFESPFAFIVGDARSSLLLRRTSIRLPADASAAHAALHVTYGAKATLEDSAIVGTRSAAITMGHEGTSLSIERSLVTGSRAGDTPPLDVQSIAIAASEGDLVMRDSAMVDNANFALAASDKAHVVVERSLFDQTAPSPDTVGLGIMTDASLTMTSSVVRNHGDSGIVFLSGKGVVASSSFAGNGTALYLDGTSYRESDEVPESAADAELVVVGTEFQENGETKREEPYWRGISLE